ncbi:MAG: hypothetical protein Kow0069_17080 [Promethearchaeota archaeon]
MYWQAFVRPEWADPEEELEPVRLRDVRDVFDGYPKLDRRLLGDLRKLGRDDRRYLLEMALEKLHARGQDVDPANWLLVWFVDFRRRPFFLLLEREGDDVLFVAAGPEEFVGFLREYHHDAIGPTFTLLTTPDMVKIAVVYTSKVKPPAYEVKRRLEKYAEVQAIVERLRATPNVEGQWFPNFAPTCPVCNEVLVGLEDARVGFGRLVCPRCGYHKAA